MKNAEMLAWKYRSPAGRQTEKYNNTNVIFHMELMHCLFKRETDRRPCNDITSFLDLVVFWASVFISLSPCNNFIFLKQFKHFCGNGAPLFVRSCVIIFTLFFGPVTTTP